jgi:hypothetical protein
MNYFVRCVVCVLESWISRLMFCAVIYIQNSESYMKHLPRPDAPTHQESSYAVGQPEILEPIFVPSVVFLYRLTWAFSSWDVPAAQDQQSMSHLVTQTPSWNVFKVLFFMSFTPAHHIIFIEQYGFPAV